jgi:hypothetical protein
MHDGSIWLPVSGQRKQYYRRLFWSKQRVGIAIRFILRDPRARQLRIGVVGLAPPPIGVWRSGIT